MRFVSVVLAASAMIAGLIAAYYWVRASEFRLRLGALPDDNDPMSTRNLITGVILSVSKASELNATAARWTAFAVVLGGVASIVGSVA